jgi:putative DNA primase/helicase
LADVAPREVEWFWPRWLVQGKLHLLAGHAGDGKSTLMAALAAIGSTGGTWPDGAAAPLLRTLFVLGEDSAEDTLRPRLDLHGADMHQIFFVETVLDDSGNERFFNVAKHLALLEDQIVEHNLNLIVIDPLTTIMPGTDRNAEGDTRDALTPLVKLAERRDVAIIGIAHVGKSNGSTRRAAQRILGATAFHAMARVVWMIAPVDDEQLALGVVKSNLAVKPATLLWSRDEDSPISWDGIAAEAVDELLSSPGPPTRLADAEAFLHEFLKGGMKTALDVEKAAMAAGVSKSTLRRAADAIPIQKWKDRRINGPWYWMLPDGQPVFGNSTAA